MNEQQQQQLQALLKQAGLLDKSKYFTGDVGSLVSSFGFTDPKQIEQFSKFFTGFDPSKYLQASEEVESRYGQQSSMLGERRSDVLQKIMSQFETGSQNLTEKGFQTEQKIGEMQAKGGFDYSGIGGKMRRKAAVGRDQSFRDLLEQAVTGRGAAERQYESGMLTAEKQRGAGRGAIYGSLQNYLNSLFGRGENIFALDPTGQRSTGYYGGGGFGTGVPPGQQDTLI
tara:strand:- start:1409 stop:2089 length:681 start_codon:yes stop_codon:yes gene_type:complete